MSPRLGTTSITRFSTRNSGRDLSAVRRPRADVKTEAPKAEPKAKPLPKSTASKPAANDASVEVSDG